MDPATLQPRLEERLRLKSRIFRHAKGVIGGSLVVGIVLAAILGPWISMHDPIAQAIEYRLLPPAWAPGGRGDFPMGTDGLGRDLLSRVLWGARLSLAVSSLSVVVAAGIGVPLGLAAGFFGGLADQLVTGLVDIQLSFPFLLLALIFVAAFGSSFNNLVIVLGLAGWASYCRMARGQVLSLREREFVLSAIAVGAPDLRILARHILPNLTPTLVVISTLNLARFMLAEASLSFLGLGASPPTPSWGSIIAEGRAYTFTVPWIQIFPGLVMVLTITGFGLLSDWLRDRLAPGVAA